MSYLDTRPDPGARAKAIIAVGSIHALLAAGLVAGLAITTAIEDEENSVVAEFLDDEIVPAPPPPPTDEPQPQFDVVPYDPPRAPAPLIDLGPPPKLPVASIGPDVSDLVVKVPLPPTREALAPVQPSPTPSFTPVGVTARNDPAKWITTDDYPASELRRGNEGVAAYRLTIGNDGKVNACEITASSGHARLDAATCKYITRRAKFAPATDEFGKQVIDTYSGKVAWRIPD